MSQTTFELQETRHTETFFRARRFSVNNCGISRGQRVWDGALQVYALGGRVFKSRRDAEVAASELEINRQPITIHIYTVWEDKAPEHRPAGALWMRPEAPPSWIFKTEEAAREFVSSQRNPAAWRIYHTARVF